MELHSYARVRGYKKWTIEQKRKLVEARINYKGIFERKSSNCVDSWKKVTAAAKLNDFNVCFVRKQWANLLAKYKAYKRIRLRQMGKNEGELSDEMVREISEEWEFFYPIHSFMSQKATNFHSYAQTPRDIVVSSEYSNAEDDEDDEKEVKHSVEMMMTVAPNTDHDFYSKSARREVLDIEVPPAPVAVAAVAVPEQNCTANSIKPPKQEAEDHEAKKVQNTLGVAAKKKKKRKPSERDKYYQHKRRYDRRNERRFDALLNVFGQVIKAHYPNVDTSKLEEQNDLVSTEDEGTTMTMSSVESESTCIAPSSEESGL